MAKYLIASIYWKDTLEKYRVYDTMNKSFTDVDLMTLKQSLRSNPDLCVNAKLEKGNIVGVGGSLHRLSIIDLERGIKKSSVVILARTQKGFLICKYNGETVDIPEDKLIAGLNNAEWGVANGKIVNNHISAIQGQYPTIEEVEKDNIKKAEEIRDGYIKITKGLAGAPIVKAKVCDTELLKLSDGIMTVQGKIQRGMDILSSFRPFYAAMLASVARIPTLTIETEAVTLKEFLYNPMFVNSITLEENAWIMFHESLHLALLHHTRGEGLRHNIANIAGDLYINRLIAVETGAAPGAGIVYANDKSKGIGGIKCPEGVLYNDTIDVYKDSFESIYRELLQENFGNNQQDNQQNGQQNNQQSGQQGSGQSGNNQQGNMGGQGSEGNEQQNQQGQGQQGQGQQGNQQGQGQPNQSQGTKGEVTEGDLTTNIKDLTFRGQKISEYADIDIVKSEKDATKSKREIAEEQKSKLSEATVRAEKDGSFGSGNSLVERLVQMQLAPKIRWETSVIQRLVSLGDSYRTYAKVNRRSPRNERGEELRLRGTKQEYDKLKGVKVCIDTSGSMSEEEIGKALGQMNQLLKKYSVTESEIIYWDAGITNIGDFNNVKEMLKVKVKGGGGTDVRPVFEYLSDRKKCKNEPSLVVVFTDGCFGRNFDDFKRSFKDKTLWVINNGEEWKAPFGKVCRMISKDDVI